MKKVRTIIDKYLYIFLAALVLFVFAYPLSDLSQNTLLDYIFKERYLQAIVASILAIILYISIRILFYSKYKLKFRSFLFSSRVITICSIIFVVFFTLLAFKKHLNLDTAIYDFALQHQVIWNTSEGRLFQSGVETANFLGDHFSPILIIPAFFYRLFPHVLTLFLIQTLCVFLAGVGIYKIAITETKNKLFALFLSFSFLLSVNLSAILLFDFHEIAFALPFLVFGIYYIINKKNFGIGFLFMVLATLSKEDVGIFVGTFGLYLVVFKKDLRGILLTFYGYIISLVALFVIIPSFRTEASDTLLRYEKWGKSGGEIVKNIITQPLEVIKHIATQTRLSYLVKLFLPVGFLPFLAPGAFLIIVPNLLINILSTSFPQVSGSAQHDVINMVAIYYVTILGFVNLEKLIAKKKWNIRLNSIILYVLLPITLCILLWHPMWRVLVKPMNRFEDYQYVHTLKARIPSDAVVAASNMVGGQFGDREHLQIFYPNWTEYDQEPDYIIVDKIVNWDEGTQIKIDSYKAKGYKIFEENDRFLTLVRSI